MLRLYVKVNAQKLRSHGRFSYLCGSGNLEKKKKLLEMLVIGKLLLLQLLYATLNKIFEINVIFNILKIVPYTEQKSLYIS